MTKFITFIYIVVIAIFLFACSDSTESNKDSAIVQGRIYYVEYNSTPVPLGGAIVTVRNYFAQSTTNVNGMYEVKIDMGTEDNPVDVTLDVSKAGYDDETKTVSVQKGKTIVAPDITLYKLFSDSTGDTSLVSGNAAHITVDGNHSSHIYVLNSGLQETAQINFLVTDAQGNSVDSTHQVRIYFDILNGPGGGEYLDPDSMTTVNGKVFTVLNSGIVAGPIQLDVYADVNSQTIRSLPIRMAIYGGLPDQEHFSLAVERLNIAGRVRFGLIDVITAFVGDKYSNPVAPGTVVYFSTDNCIIEGGATTDELGRASVRLISADPLPPNPQDSSFAHITAWTYEDTVLENVITAPARVLLSDVTASIQINPTSFQYDNTNTPVHFEYVVSDIWGNPLVETTRIDVNATDGDLYGDVDFELQDTQIPGPGNTNFQFTWAPGDSLEAPQVYITIKVEPPPDGNGYRSLSILGTKTTD